MLPVFQMIVFAKSPLNHVASSSFAVVCGHHVDMIDFYGLEKDSNMRHVIFNVIDVDKGTRRAIGDSVFKYYGIN